MKSLITRSFVIALAVGLVATATASVLTATFEEHSQVLGAGRVLMGLDAVKAAINALGFWAYVKGLVGAFALFFASVFVGTVWQGIWTSERSSA